MLVSSAIFELEVPQGLFSRTMFWMVTSENKSIQMCLPKAKTAHLGLYAYSNGFA